jgi:UDP-glucose 4-epimerase
VYFLYGSENPRTIIVLFGKGLIGSALVECLQLRGMHVVSTHPTDWDNLRPGTEHYSDHRGKITDLASGLVRKAGQIQSFESPQDLLINFVWSAGRGGFSATEEELEPELFSFQAVLELVKDSVRGIDSVRTRFFHFSSAGGLYEGQKCVSEKTRPNPLRPYGELKLRQELLLSTVDFHMEKTIYRPSSVYGPVRMGQRLGLIPNMIRNGIQHRVTSIYARDSTLRDFVWVYDLAGVVSSQMLNFGVVGGTHILHTGAPVSVGQVRLSVEKLLGRRVYVRYSDEYDNSSDITFMENALCRFTNKTPMSSAMKMICMDLKH